MAPLELGSELARESFPKLGGVSSDLPVCDRGISALRGKNVTGDIELAVNGGSRKIHVAIDQPATVGVKNLAYDPETGRFVASLAAPARKRSCLLSSFPITLTPRPNFQSMIKEYLSLQPITSAVPKASVPR